MAQGVQEAQRAPTLADLRAMPDEELVERHDAAMRIGNEPPLGPEVYREVLHLRMEEQRIEALYRMAVALVIATGVALVIALIALILTR